jgi:FkbM family methyltransferase
MELFYLLRKRASNLLLKLSRRVCPGPRLDGSLQSQRVAPWLADKGDRTHRLNYLLNHDSLVFDLGGYEGQWAADIFCKYGCSIHIFEPVSEYSKRIRSRFEKNDKVTVHEFGLGPCTEKEFLSMSFDGSSIFGKDLNKIEISLVDAADFINSNHIDSIDLLKVNIEGAEYDLLDYMISIGLMTKVRNLQVQFHDFVPNAMTRMKNIQTALTATHHLTYQYEFVWENWAINKDDHS